MKESLKKVYKKEYFIYMGILFLPLIWKITQICFLNSFENSMKILGQISLMAIIFKCFQETILNPLYKIFNDEKTNQDLKQKIQIKFLFFYSIATIIFTLIVFFYL